jgi:hypothetical protein
MTYPVEQTEAEAAEERLRVRGTGVAEDGAAVCAGALAWLNRAGEPDAQYAMALTCSAS